jgi:hypothetical protein
MTAATGRVSKTIGFGIASLLMVAALPSMALAVTPVVTQYAMSPAPIAAPGALAAGATVSITVSAETATNSLVPGAVIYLSFTQALGGGAAFVGVTSLGKTPVAFTAASGTVTVTYDAPAVLPATGRDTIKAGDAKSLPTIVTIDSYDFAAPASYLWSPDPVAVPASLAAGATASVTVTAEDASAVPIPSATVYLSFVPSAGGGSAAVGLTALTGTPAAFVAGPTGQITITYTMPVALPLTGTDTFSAQQTPTSARRTTSYSYGTLVSLTFSPNPIAVAGSLTAGQGVTVTLQAKDGMGNPVSGQTLYLSFVPATNGGSAMFGTKALSATPIQVKTDSSGLILILYSASTTALTTGTDTLMAANAKTSPTLSATDTYSITTGPLNHLVLSLANATVNPGVAEAYTATGYDAHGVAIGDVTSATTFTIAGGNCAANLCSASAAGVHTVTGTDGSATGTATLTVSNVVRVRPGDTFHPITPIRLLDTRSGNGFLGKLFANTPITFQITGRGVPAGATAVTGNLTVTDSSFSWAVYLGPDPLVSPASSTINFEPGEIRANGLTVALSSTGSLSATYLSTAGNSTDLVFDVTGYFTPDTSGATYHPITPARVLDTRSGNGLATRLTANTPVTFQITGRGGVPAGATAVTANVTIVGETASWAVYVGPNPTASPGTSTLNFNAGDIKANNLTVALGSGGTLSATYISTAGNTTDLVLDVTGYYTADLTGGEFVPIAPVRLLDTRSGNGLTGKFDANTPRSFQITGGGVPANATAISGNVTVVNETASWAVFVGPDPSASPTTSTVNFAQGQVVANGLTVALGSGGSLSATYMSTAGNTTDLVLDVTGYFVAAG